DDGLRALLEAPWAPSLRELRLFCTRITQAGVAALAGSASLANLRVLELDHHVVGEQAAEALAKSPHLNRLLRLRIHPKKPRGEHLPPRLPRRDDPEPDAPPQPRRPAAARGATGAADVDRPRRPGRRRGPQRGAAPPGRGGADRRPRAGPAERVPDRLRQRAR